MQCMYVCFAVVCLLLGGAFACNESKLRGPQQQDTDKAGGGDQTDDTGNGVDLPQGNEVVAQVGKLFNFDVDLSGVQLPVRNAEYVRLHVVDADGRELPEAIMMWIAPRNEREEWLNNIGTSVMAELEGQRAYFDDIFLRVNVPAGAALVISVVAGDKSHTVRQRPLRSEHGKYQMKVVYAEPGIRGAPVIEFNFDPGVPARNKGHWYVAERGIEGNVTGYSIVGSAFTHLPLPSEKLVAHPSRDLFDKDSYCYVALVYIDDNVKADYFGEC